MNKLVGPFAYQTELCAINSHAGQSCFLGWYSSWSKVSDLPLQNHLFYQFTKKKSPKIISRSDKYTADSLWVSFQSQFEA